ncbi:MAG: serine/threonine protein kinase [Elusimicrobia bacterium]|nr:serine/threonine protein kinase [Elusimicrobiota bacterium]
MKRLLLAAALTLPAAAAENGANPAEAYLDELVELQREGDPLRETLREVRASFTPEADLPAVKARFTDAHRGLSSVRDRVKELEDRLTGYIKQTFSLMVVDGMSVYSGAGRRKPSQASLERAGQAVVNEDIKAKVRSYRRRVDDELGAAQNHYVDFERSWHQRRNTRMVYAAVGGLAAVFIVVAVWLARRKSEPVTVAAYPTAAPQGLPTIPPPGGALSGPASGALLSGPVGQLPPPNTLGGNFRVDGELGRGGMGVVYEATDMALNRKVAIKRMRDEVSANRRELDMFMAEARLVAQLKHPNLVAIHHIFREGTILYLVFEFVLGRPLSAVIEETERLSLDEARRVLRGVAAGLDYAHANKVIHRDLKPSNVMLSDDGTVKVMDFGIAHQAKKTVARLTKADAWGTPPYMSPEQELGTVSRESDVYSLTVCLYEMLTGRLPFEGPNFLAQKREMAYIPPSQACPGLPAALDAVVRRGLEAEVARRFHSAAELTAALEGVS